MERGRTQIFAGASAGSDRKAKGDGPATFASFRSVMTTTSEITDTSGTTTKMKVAKTQVRGGQGREGGREGRDKGGEAGNKAGGGGRGRGRVYSVRAWP